MATRLNVEFTSAELEAMANTVPSLSLEEDVNETLERIFHRAVAQIQMKLHERVESAMQQAALEVNSVTVCSPLCAVQQDDQIRLAVLRWMEEERRKVKITIEQMRRLLEHRKELSAQQIDYSNAK